MNGTIRLIIAEDHPVTRMGLLHLLAAEPDLQVVGEAADGPTARDLCLGQKPDVAVMDVGMPGLDADEVLAALVAAGCPTRVLILTAQATVDRARRLLARGAWGFLPKSAEPAELTRAIRAVHRGRRYVDGEVAAELAAPAPERLTEREIDVLQQVATGASNRQAAETLGISEATVRTHVQNILGKLGAADRTEATVIAIRRGIITP